MPVHDSSRQHRLARHYLTGSEPSRRLQETISLAASALDFPHGQVNILDDTLQHTISDHDGGGVHVIPRTDSICTHTVAVDDVLALEDMRLDPRSSDLPGVRAGMAVSYLGVPLHSREAASVGTLCFFDTVPRVITEEQMERIKKFGRIVEDRLDLMRRAKEHKLAGHDAAEDLATAIERDEIVPWFQPIVDLHANRVLGYEALARWEHPGSEIRDAGSFVPLAEDSDLIVDLDRAVMRRALAELACWQESDPELRMGVNLSTRHLEIPGGVSSVHRIVLDAGISPTSISLELTETRELADAEAARQAVAQFRGYGYDVVLDDFGNGWSSLDWILGLPISGIKIDRAVTAALGSPAGDAIAHALAVLAHDLDLSIVIEGISTRAHVDIAKTLGYHHGQGYYWTPPLPTRFDPCPRQVRQA